MDNNPTTLPCIDCITLPICRSYYLKEFYDYDSDSLDCWMIRESLEAKCQLLFDYNLKTDKEQINKFHKYMQDNTNG
jgi:hypothetical protein